MEGSRTKNSLRNVLAGSANKFIMMIFPFITRTIIIKEIGIEYIGLNGMFSSILSFLSLTELGFGSALIYSMYKPLAENDTERVCALLNLYKKIFRVVGAVILVIGLLLMPFLDYLVEGDYPSDINQYSLYLVFLLNSVISYFMFSYKSALLSGCQREDVNSNVSMFVNMGMYITQIVLLLTLKNYMTYIIVMPIATIVTNLVRCYIANKMYPEYQCHGTIPKSEVKVIVKNVTALFGHRVSGTIILSSDNLVISSFLGLTAVACYDNYYYIINALVGFVTVLFNAMRPSVGNSLVSESIEKNYIDFKRINYIIAWIIGWCSVCLLCLFQPFMKLWVGEEYLLPFKTVILFSLYFFEWKMLDVLILYRDAAGMWWSDKFRPYVVAALNLIGNIVLVNLFGLDGVVFATLFTSGCISFPWVVHVLFKELFKRSSWEYIKQLFYSLVVVAATAIGTYMFTNFICGDGFLYFILRCLLCVIIPNCVFLVAFGTKKVLKEKLISMVRVNLRK